MNIATPGTPDSIHVLPASGYVFSQDPNIVNNPSGLWLDAGGNTFSIVFLSGGATSADVMIAGKLKPTGSGSGGGSGLTPEYDFSLPEIAVLGNSVGALFQNPYDIWEIEGEVIPCFVRLYSGAGSVTAGTDAYSWSGDNLGAFSSSSSHTSGSSMYFSFTYTVGSGTAGKQGQIQGNYSNVQVNGAGSYSAAASSLIQKAFKVDFVKLKIVADGPSLPVPDRIEAHAAFIGQLKFTPKPDIPIQLRMPQSVVFYGEYDYINPVSRVCRGPANVFDGYHALTMTWVVNDLYGFGDDYPVAEIPVTDPNFVYFTRTDTFTTYLQAQIGNRAYKTYGINYWGWQGSYTTGAPNNPSGFSYPSPSTDGAASSANSPPEHPNTDDVHLHPCP